MRTSKLTSCFLSLTENKVSLPASGTVESGILRLCFGFCREKKTILDKIDMTNQQLNRILKNANNIASMRQSGTASSRSLLADVTPFLTLQKRSQTLFRALKSETCCSCHQPHGFGLSTQWDKSKGCDSDPTLALLFEDPRGRKQIRWEVEVADRSSIPPMNEDAHHSGMSGVLALSTLAIVTSPTNPRPESIWTSSRKKLKKPISVVQSALKRPARSLSNTKTTCLGLTTSTQVQGSYVTAAKKVQMAVPPTQARAHPRITNMCSLITTPQRDKFLGTIEAEYHDIGLYLYPQFQRRLQESRIETMESFWTATGELSHRLRIGLSMAVTLLSLGTSAWVPPSWTREDVALMRCGGNSREDAKTTFGPYFRQICLSTTLQNDPEGAERHAEKALFALGVFLLELYYQQALQESPYWDLHCPQGRPEDGTAQAAAHDWYEELDVDPELEGLAEPIRRCIGIKFSTAADLGNGEFVRDVLETVVKPLEEYIQQLAV